MLPVPAAKDLNSAEQEYKLQSVRVDVYIFTIREILHCLTKYMPAILA
jgi:hypothetical protein